VLEKEQLGETFDLPGSLRVEIDLDQVAEQTWHRHRKSTLSVFVEAGLKVRFEKDKKRKFKK